jgi:hypothetical protein
VKLRCFVCVIDEGNKQTCGDEQRSVCNPNVFARLQFASATFITPLEQLRAVVGSQQPSLDWIISFASAVIASCTNGDKLDVEEPRYDRALQVQLVKKHLQKQKRITQDRQIN